MDIQKAWDIVIAEIEGECNMHAHCEECPIFVPCVNINEAPFDTLKVMRGKLYGID